jgi:hypothetical protein
MANIALMAEAEIGAEADRLTREFSVAVETMRRRRAAAGNLRSGAMLAEIRTIGEASLEVLKAKAEEVFIATWPRAVWISEAEEGAMLASAGIHLQALHDTVRERVRAAVADVAARPAVLAELEPPLQACLDRCKERLVLVLQLQRQSSKVSLIKRGIGLIPSAARAAIKSATGFFVGR